MLKYAVLQWENNKQKLEEAIRKDGELYCCDYDYLVKLVIRHILNGECIMPEMDYIKWSEDFDTIDNGDYQGSLIFVIHREMYQPSPSDYIMTCAYYGSCSGCDTLMDIQCSCYDGEKIPDNAVKDFMALCKDIVTQIVHPFEMYERWEEMEFEN